MKKIQLLPLILLIFTISILFKPLIFQSLLPIPSDTIIGLYNPFRDLYAKNYPNGIPYKNFLITDPVRQQYPWRWISINLEKNMILPLWNPYNMTGVPLLGNQQSSVFYPLNMLLFILPFSIGWSILIFLQPLLAALFMYFYLQNLKLKKIASFLGSLTYSLCGFMVAWMEWGTVGQVALWAPLILLSIDNIYINMNTSGISNIKNKKLIIWSFIFIFSLASSFFAGHLQTFFYLYLTSIIYFFVRWLQLGRPVKALVFFIILNSCFLFLTAVQWLPLFQFISLSARDIDQNNWHQAGWFIPWQHLVQFIAPDFFGNPTTLNYWGVWNYGELVGYVGILPLIFSFYALFFRQDKKTLFFGTFFFLSLIFSLPTFFAEIPFLLQLPFLSMAQPTRLLFLTDFALAVLSALGMDYFLRTAHKRQLLVPLISFAAIFIFLWIFIFYGVKILPSISAQNMAVARHNIYFPTIIFVIVSFLLLFGIFNRNKKTINITFTLLILITVIDLMRFAQKFTPFTDANYLFPQTTALTYLDQQKGQFRIMATDNRILPPNFSIMYHLQSLDGYDPLYLRRYGELIAAIERNSPDINPPFGFDRIITPHNINSRLIDLLGVQYVLSLTDLHFPKLEKVFTEGQTKVYKNKDAFPRTFFVQKIKTVNDKNEAIDALFDKNVDLRKVAIIESPDITNNSFSNGDAKIISYSENRVTIDTQAGNQAFLVLMDTFYPTWHAVICSSAGTDCSESKIYLTNYNFRGIVVPAGKHEIIYYNSLI